MKRHSSQKAFTLIEMTIVLVIIGLVLGSIYVATDVLDAARRQHYISDIQTFQAGFDQFKVKYEEPPGDLSDASAYWSSAHNGNGDMQIDWGTASPTNESRAAWNHLALAGFLDVPYTGTITGDGTIPGAGVVRVGSDLPKGPYKASGYTIGYNYWGTSAYDGGIIPTNMINLGALTSIAYGEPNMMANGVMTPAEAYAIDVKIDDGTSPGGKFFGWHSFDYDKTISCVDCTRTDTYGGCSYRLTSKSPECIVSYRLERIRK